MNPPIPVFNPHGGSSNTSQASGKSLGEAGLFSVDGDVSRIHVGGYPPQV